MSTKKWEEEDIVYKNDTGPVLEFLFLKEDARNVRDLTGWHGWVSFWYADGDPLVRAGVVDGANGILRYFPQGDEYSVAGKDVLIQATVELTDMPTGTDRAYFSVSFPIVRRTVLEKP
jgi:hypothetical protein